MWASIGLWVGAMVVGSIVAAQNQETPTNATPASKSDFEVPTIEEGTYKRILFGSRWMDGSNVAWWGDLHVVPIWRSVDSGGKK